MKKVHAFCGLFNSPFAHILLLGMATVLTATLWSVNAANASTGSWIEFGNNSGTGRTFALNQADAAIQDYLTISESAGDGGTLRITSVNNIRLILPSGYTWDSEDTTITAGGPNIGRLTKSTGGSCSSVPCTVTVSYANSNMTMIVPVEDDFSIDQYFNIHLWTVNVSGFASGDDGSGIGASFDGNDTIDIICDTNESQTCSTSARDAGAKILAVSQPTLSYTETQYSLGQEGEPLQMTVTADADVVVLNSTDDLRITIPSALGAVWPDWDDGNATNNAVTLSVTGTGRTGVAQSDGGAACAATPCVVTAALEDSDRTLVVPIHTTPPTTGQTIIIDGISLAQLETVATDNLELEVAGSDVGSSPTYTATQSIIVASAASTNMDRTAAGGVTSATAEVNSEGNVVLTWTDPTDEDLMSVNILRGVDPDPVSGTTYASVDAGTQTYTDTDVNQGDTLTYRLQTVDESNNLNVTDIVEVSATVPVDETPPAQVTDLAAELNGDLQVVLTWTDPTDEDYTYVYIYKSVEPETITAETPVLTEVAAGVRTYTDTTVTPGETVTYRFQTEDGSDNQNTTSPPEATITVVAQSATTEGEEVVEEEQEATEGEEEAVVEGEEEVDEEVVEGEEEEGGEDEEEAPLPFTDIPENAYYAGAVRYALSANWIDSGTEYRPGNIMTRCDFAQIVLRSSGTEASAAFNATFSDVPASHPAAAAVYTGIAQGWWQGQQDGSGTFGCNSGLIRAEAAVIVANALGLTQEDNYTPADGYPAWALSYIRRVHAAGLMLGMGDGTNFGAEAQLNRADALVIWYRVAAPTQASLSQMLQAFSLSEITNNPAAPWLGALLVLVLVALLSYKAGRKKCCGEKPPETPQQ
jgi:hypothetical protein